MFVAIIFLMLQRLTISNLAIIENVDISFKEGFTVLTGPTGAGKSLVIDSLSLLLGDRASSELIRAGEEKASIRGEFIISSKRLEAILDKMEIPPSSSLVVERTITKNKNTIKINGATVTLFDLNKISPFLADIHSQFDYAKILNHDNYLSMIDGYAYERIKSYKNEYSLSLEEYNRSSKELSLLEEQKRKLDENRDFYLFQSKELEDANLIEGEEESNEKELSLLKNYDKVYSLAKEADEIIREDFIDRLYDLNKDLLKLSEYNASYEEAYKKLDDKYYEIVDIFDELKKKFKSFDYDPERLNVLQQREYDLNSLKRKYRKSVNELIAYREELKELLKIDSSIDKQISEKAKEKDALYKNLIAKGEDLSKVRKQVAKEIEEALKKNLSDLLLRAEFEIEFVKVEPNENGIDEVNFLIETNIGEGKKNLEKTISGGEASRIMLAFKSIFLFSNKIETAIFDEIDVGISGEAASAVGKKIKEISLFRQVIAITHLPQVASKSDHHILIEKIIKDGRTYSILKELSLEEKIEQIAKLISGGKVTEKQLEYAKEMVLEN